jgi:3-deoxy-D-manno-octulosonate 8-phosphate phosphatase (KDO 8-P phosphatase)
MTFFRSVNTFVFDVDGVLTDGSLYLMQDGEMVRRMNIKDGYALQLAKKKGYHVIIISGAVSEPVKLRLQKLGITDVYMGVHDKRQLLQELMQRYQLQPDQVLFMGDDIPDLEVMANVGLPCCPTDACTEAQEISRYISPFNGGMGCARDVIEKVMKLRGDWHHTTEVVSK